MQPPWGRPKRSQNPKPTGVLQLSGRRAAGNLCIFIWGRPWRLDSRSFCASGDQGGLRLAAYFFNVVHGLMQQAFAYMGHMHL